MAAFVKIDLAEGVPMRTAMVIIALLMPLSIQVRADPLPLPKRPGGVCPYGYVSDGSFCNPSQGAQEIVPKSHLGTCPYGWISSGSSFCFRSAISRSRP
jgi:hypothetical protein